MITQPISLDTPTEEFVHILIYGGPGVGKTVLAGGSQRLRTVIFDVDSGAVSLKTWPTIQRQLIKLWPVGPDSGKVDFMSGMEWLYAHQGSFDLVVIDTATELQKVLLAEITKAHKMVAPDQQCWGEILLMMENITRLFRVMKKHVIFLAHEVKDLDMATNRLMYMPSFQGQYGTQYAKHFDALGQYGIIDQQVKDPATSVISTKVVRFIRFQRNQFSDAKDRFNVLAEYETPDIDYLIGKMLSAIRASNSK